MRHQRALSRSALRLVTGLLGAAGYTPGPAAAAAAAAIAAGAAAAGGGAASRAGCSTASCWTSAGVRRMGAAPGPCSSSAGAPAAATAAAASDSSAACATSAWMGCAGAGSATVDREGITVCVLHTGLTKTARCRTRWPQPAGGRAVRRPMCRSPSAAGALTCALRRSSAQSASRASAATVASALGVAATLAEARGRA